MLNHQRSFLQTVLEELDAVIMAADPTTELLVSQKADEILEEIRLEAASRFDEKTLDDMASVLELSETAFEAVEEYGPEDMAALKSRSRE